MSWAGTDGGLDALWARLEEVAEHLGELQMRALGDAIDAGQARGSDAERQLGRARRSVERAVAILRKLSSDQQ